MANVRAARIGPTVCELDGPIPMLNRSKTLTLTKPLCAHSLDRCLGTMARMSDEVTWFWAGEHGRDQILRDSVEDLHSQLSQSSQQSYRLSSQLAELKGSLEARLTALSIAFDAYVELGDIREQLAGYPDTSQLRREVRDTLTALTEGRPAEPIDPRDLPYWLPYAMNAVLAIAAGSPDLRAEETALSLSPDATLFIVAAAGAVGRGHAVRDRLPDLLVSDGTLSPAQRALWAAAGRGTFGDVRGVLADIEPVWRPAIAAVDPADWVRSVREPAGDGSLAAVEWICARIGLEPSDHPTTSSGDRASSPAAGLRTVVAELAGGGLGGEVELLRRAHDLRARIEQPIPAAGEEPAAETGIVRVAIIDEVCQTLTDDGTGIVAREVVLGWLAPALSAALEIAEQDAVQAPDFTESVSSAAGAVPVTPAGADAILVEQRCAEIRSAQRPSRVGLYLFGGIGVSMLIAGVALVATGNPGSAFLFFFLAGVGCLGVLYQLRQLSTAKDAEFDVERFRERIGEAHATARSREQQWRTELDTIRRLAAEARQRLRSTGAGAGEAHVGSRNTLPAHTRQGAGTTDLSLTEDVTSHGEDTP